MNYILQVLDLIRQYLVEGLLERIQHFSQVMILLNKVFLTFKLKKLIPQELIRECFLKMELYLLGGETGQRLVI